MLTSVRKQPRPDRFGVYARLLTDGIQESALRHIRAAALDVARLDHVSARERKILALVAEGWSNAQIGTQLSIAKRTVDGHLQRISSKLGVQTRTYAAEYLRRPTAKGEYAQPGLSSHIAQVYS